MNKAPLSRTQLCVEHFARGGSFEKLMPQQMPALSEIMNEYIGRMNIPLIVIAELAGMNNATLHRILNGDMNPSRNTLLRLAFTLNMPYDAAQLLLKVGNRSMLSGQRDRDLIIMQGLIQRLTLSGTNDLLIRSGYHDLFSKQD